MKKQSKQKISVIQRAIWDLCKKLIRTKYGNVCYTCGATGLSGKNWHTGHMLAKGSLGAYLKYDLRLLRPQCMMCNIHHGGMGAEFIEKMRRVEGNMYVNKILRDKNVSVKAYDHYVKILNEYQTLLLSYPQVDI